MILLHSRKADWVNQQFRYFDVCEQFRYFDVFVGKTQFSYNKQCQLHLVMTSKAHPILLRPRTLTASLVAAVQLWQLKHSLSTSLSQLLLTTLINSAYAAQPFNIDVGQYAHSVTDNNNSALLCHSTVSHKPVSRHCQSNSSDFFGICLSYSIRCLKNSQFLDVQTVLFLYFIQ